MNTRDRRQDHDIDAVLSLIERRASRSANSICWRSDPSRAPSSRLDAGTIFSS